MKLGELIKSPIRWFLRLFHYEILKTAHVREDLPYQAYRLVANYAPWNADEEFIKVFRQVKPNTAVDIYRCYELWTLVEQSKKLQGALIEIGVWRGGSGALIAKQASLCGIDAPVYLCDTFSGVPKASAKDSSYRGGEHADTSPEIVKALVNRLGLTNVRVLPGVFPEHTSHLIPETQFRFCHIDVDTYLSSKDVTDWIWDKLVVGGMIVHDDYGLEYVDGITRHVEEQRDCSDRLVIHNLNGHAVIVKIK